MARWKNIAVVGMVMLPLIIMAVVRFGPLFLAKPKISSVSILPPHIYGPKQLDYMNDDIPTRLRESLSSIPNLQIRRTPLPSEVGEANLDLMKLSGMVGGADVLVQPTVTVDEGILELGLEAFDPRSRQVYYNELFDSPIDQYPAMIQAAGRSLNRGLHP
jgi:hypothetical protein